MNAKVDVVKIVKMAGTVMSVAGTLMTGWAANKENKQTIENLVNEHLKNK